MLGRGTASYIAIILCIASVGCSDDDPASGCAATFGTISDCGACGVVCGGQNGTPYCIDNACELICDAGFSDCDNQALNGCEATLNSLGHCLGCGDLCAEVNGSAQCLADGCALTCDAGFYDCDDDASTGCELAIDTPQNCGACAAACGTANTTSVECLSTLCSIVCADGFADCDGDHRNGCEVDISDNPNCGACGVQCAGNCVAQQCEVCDSGTQIDSDDPMDAARALGLCFGVTSAAWVAPDGTAPAADPDVALGHGLLPAFGPNVAPLEGSHMLVLSSGAARQPTDPGYQDPAGFDKGYLSPSPAGFPQESPSCPGVTTGDPRDGIAVEISLFAPQGVQGFSFAYNFYTYEWPAFVCDQYNDFFLVLMNPPPPGAISGNVAMDAQSNPVSVNSAFIDVCDCDAGPPCNAAGKIFDCSLGGDALHGTGFSSDTDMAGVDHAATGWVRTQVPITEGTAFTLRFTIYDSGDGMLDSTALIDSFRWISEATTLGTTREP